MVEVIMQGYYFVRVETTSTKARCSQHVVNGVHFFAVYSAQMGVVSAIMYWWSSNGRQHHYLMTFITPEL